MSQPLRIDYTPPASAGSSSSGAPTTPTTMQGNLTLAPYTQMLFRQPITVGSHSIILGAGASLISV